ncbi:MAG: iron-containing alcohol dehydrogenase family protein [Clostridiales bacterium]|nr:iron-containing alcohol dehydrogenase family protein [Clostridiales bacterium]
MEINHTYYKKIIYKKNAFEDIKTYIKLNFNNKNILLVSTKSVQAEDVTCLLNSLFCGSENVCHFVSRQNFEKSELDLLNNKLISGKYNLLVAFGGGKCCDVVKYFASIIGVPYIVCPTVATSLAYFSNYCINPYDSTKSFYADFPAKIFIQEQIIKGSSCYFNLQGLCFIHSLRALYLEGIMRDNEKERYIFMGLEKVFAKLEYEQTNILLCGEDSNLVLMDLLIDFGFWIGLLNREEYYLFNMFNNLENLDEKAQKEMSGKKMLLCAKSILLLMQKYIELNSVYCLEKNNFQNLAILLKSNKIEYKLLKNNIFFNNFNKKVAIKHQFLLNKETEYKMISTQLLKIKEFANKVRMLFKTGIEMTSDISCVFKALAITPFIYNSSSNINIIANSGVLNCFMQN